MDTFPSDTVRSKFIGHPGLERATRRQAMADLRNEKLRWQHSQAPRQLRCRMVGLGCWPAKMHVGHGGGFGHAARCGKNKGSE